MGSPKTNCKKCGTEILQITADLNEGRCMPCKKDDWRKEVLIPQIASMVREHTPILNHKTNSEDVLVSIHFHPGFTPDLTSWTFQISRDGIMRQAVWWYTQRHDRPEEELDSVRLDDATMKRLGQLITEAESLKLAEIGHLSCIDDAAMVSVRFPRSGEHADIPMLSMQEDIRKGRRKLTDVEKPRFSVVEAIWMLADRHARYSINEHHKGRTRRHS